MFKHRLMLSVAATALLASPAFATTTISTATTTEVKTATANAGAPDNVVISAAGSVTINAAGPTVLINSANFVDNQGKISNINTGSAQGIVIDASGAPAAGWTLPAGTTSILNDNGTIDLTGSGEGKTGILFSGGKFTGDIVLTASSVTNITGDNSVGVVIASGSTLDGDLTAVGDLLVSPTKAGSTTGSNTIGIDVAGILTGDLNVGGHLSAVGEGAAGVVVTSTGSVGGSFTNVGTIFATGVVTPNSKVANPEASAGVLINGSLGGGFYNSGPNAAADGTPSGVISLAGTGAAVLIGNGIAADITLGAVPLTLDSANTAGFGFINHGTITVSPVDQNEASAVIGVQLGGNSAHKLTVAGGVINTGVISGSSSSATGAPNAAAAGFAVGLDVAFNAVVPKIVNQSFAAGAGVITGTVSGTAGGKAVGILIATGANPGGTMEIDNLSGGRITGTAATSDASITGLQAYGIEDLSGTLTLVNNEGTIAGSASNLDDKSQKAIAIDVTANTSGFTLNNGGNGFAGTVTGDVLMGSGSDTVNVVGISDTKRSSIFGVLNFSSTTGLNPNDVLNIQGFSDVSTALLSDLGHLDVSLASSSTLEINNAILPTPKSTLLHNLTVSSGSDLTLTVAEGLGTTGLIQAKFDGFTDGIINLQSGSDLNLKFGSFVSATNNFVLLDAAARNLIIPDAALYASNFTTPFLFTGGLCTHNVAAFAGTTTECAADVSSNPHSQLIMSLTPKTVGTSAGQLALTGYAALMYPITNQVLPLDNALGAAVVTGVNNLTDAQNVYDAFAPTVNGGGRALAVAFTDQATGPIGARQRVLRTYGKQPGESTLWGIEYAQFLKDPGSNGSPGSSGTPATAVPASLLTGFKDHGFGFSLGADGGSASDGWYGGALSFYTGDIGEIGNRRGQAQTEWYMLTGYTDWRGRGFFLDTNLDVGVAQFKGKRGIDINLGTSTFSRTAVSKHIGVFLAGGVTTGVVLKYAGTSITPQLSLDGLTMRENGYVESGGGPATGDAFDLAVGASYANSLRSYAGVDFRQDIDLGDFFLQPEGRIGYRYDFVGSPQKVTANFMSLPGTSFTVMGPDPSQGNVVAGGTLAASTDTWSIGVSFDWVRGSNGATQQSGQFVLVGRI